MWRLLGEHGCDDKNIRLKTYKGITGWSEEFFQFFMKNRVKDYFCFFIDF
jgi:hypothetical protein